MKQNLLCPMQMRMHGAMLNETPTFLLSDPTDDVHCVILTNEALDQSLWITLSNKGVYSIFPCRRTAKEEYKNSDPFIATSNAPLWDPRDAMLKSQKEAITDDAWWLHKPGGASENLFLENFGLGSDTPMPQQSLQLARIFSDRV